MKKRDIVKTHQDFNNIIKSNKSIGNNSLVIYYKYNKDNKHSRYGISVGKKLGNAVFRNKYKRKLRMIITNNNFLYDKKYDYIIILKKSAVNLTYEMLEKKYIDLANKLKEL